MGAPCASPTLKSVIEAEAPADHAGLRAPFDSDTEFESDSDGRKLLNDE